MVVAASIGRIQTGKVQQLSTFCMTTSTTDCW